MTLAFRYDAHSEIGLVRKTNQDSGYVSPTMLMVADGMGGAAAGDLASTVAARELEATDARLDERLAAAQEDRLAEADAAAADAPGDDPEATIVQPAVRDTHEADAAAPATGDAEDTIVQPALREQADAADAEATVSHATPATDTADDLRSDVLAVIAGALQRANDRIAQLVDDDPGLEGMGTTVCGGVLFDRGLALVNIGDSRGYLIRDGQLERLTKDHSWVQTLVDEGRITEAEALEHPHRSLILRVLNGNPQHEPDLGFCELHAGDRLMFCSDGLCGLVTDEQIAQRIGHHSRTDAIDDLVHLAHEAGGHDNITIVIADVVEGEPEGAPAVLGAAESTHIPAPGEHTASLRGLPLEAEDEDGVTAAPAPATLTEDARYAPRARRGLGTRFRILLGVLLPVLLLAGGGYGWYSYTQTQYYVGASDEQVAVYRGVPDRILGRDLSRVVESTDTRVTDLPPLYAEKVRQNIRVDNLEAARSTTAELKQLAERCIRQREERARAATPPASPSPSPSPATASPGGTASPGRTASPTPVATTTPPAPVTAPEDC